ncbi:MAG TPA: hypothetical protein VD861_15575 [Pyrinomonadaceae bacterium]|nr:hypothetical protein [Pyrinomonadaceae bacterium]
MTYAVYKGDPYYHVMASAGLNRTLCNLSTKGSRRNVREVRPAARVTLDPPPSYLYDPCPLCEAARAEQENSPEKLDG